MTPSPSPTPAPADRLASLDQFRGYTVVGMLFVNFAGGYKSIPTTFGHHHTYCSYADTIMPQFLFAVGFAMRLTFLKRLAVEGAATAYKKAIFRGLGLMLLGCVVYHLTGGFKSWSEVQSQNWPKFFEELFKRGPFETLTHIGATTLLCLPFIAKTVPVRIGATVGFAIAHIVLSIVWYYKWNLTSPNGIDGGPLACFSWAVPLLIGSLVYDLKDKPMLPSLGLGVALCALAMTMMFVGNRDAAFPFTGPGPKETVKLNEWTMSQRAGSVTYTLFGAGFAVLVYQLFRVLSDRLKFNVPVFDQFGRHALAAYIIHDMVAGMVKPFTPRDAPAWYVLSAFAVYFGVSWLFVRYLDRNKLFLRL